MLVGSAVSASQSVGIAIATCNVVKLTVQSKDGQQTRSSVINIDHAVLSLAICSTSGEDFCVVIGTSSGIYCSHTVECIMGTIRQISARKGTWPALSPLSLASSTRFICSSEEGIYATAPASNTEELDVLKSKLAINSEVGPQNRLLLYKEKLTVVRLLQLAESSSDLIIVSKSRFPNRSTLYLMWSYFCCFLCIVVTDPISALCSVHWGTADITNNAITLHWSMSIPMEYPVLPSSIAHTVLSPGAAVWTCMAVGTEVWILSARGLLGKVDLSVFPRVCAIATRSTVFRDHMNLNCTRGTVLLSCIGGAVLELVVEITDSACVAQSITEKHMYTIYNAQSIQRQLPSCEGIIILPWLCGTVDSPGDSTPLILFCYSAQFGCEVLGDGEDYIALRKSVLVLFIHYSCMSFFAAEAKEVLQEEQLMWNSFHALHSVAGITNAVPLNGTIFFHAFVRHYFALIVFYLRRVWSSGQHLLAKHYCAATDQNALSKLSTSPARLHCTHRHPLLLDALADLRIAYAGVTRGAESVQLLALTSQSTHQSAFYWQGGKDQLTPCDDGWFLSDEVTIDVFAVGDLVVQVTPRSVVVFGGAGETQAHSVEREDGLARRATGSSVRSVQVDVDGALKQGGSAQGLLSDFHTIQFACMVGTRLFLGSERVLLELSVAMDKTLAVERTYVLPAALRCVAGCTLGAAAAKCSGIVAIAYWDLHVVHVLHMNDGTIDTNSPAVCIVAHEADKEVRLLCVSQVPNSETLTYAVLVVTSRDRVKITHVPQNTQSGARVSTLAKDMLVTRHIRAVQAVPSGFVLCGSEAHYTVRYELIGIDFEWTCSEFQAPSRQKMQSICAISGRTSGVEVCWMESSGTDDSSASLCFGELLQGAKTSLLEGQVHVAGKILSMDVSVDATKLVVLSDHFNGEKDLVLGCTTVREGEVAVYDLTSMQCLWRQAIANDVSDTVCLIAALVGPQPMVRYGAPPAPKSFCVSLLQASAAVTVGALFRCIVLTVLSVPVVPSTSSPQDIATPLGSVEITWDVESADPEPLNSSEAAPSIVPPAQPVVHFASLADDVVVLCLPGNALCLVGWAAGGAEALQLVEFSRLNLLEKV